MLKYLEMKCYNVCNLLSKGSKRENKMWAKCQQLANLILKVKGIEVGVHCTIRFNKTKS